MSRRVNLPHPEIIEAAAIGATLLLDDGKLRLRVVRKRGDALETEVTVGGALSDRKGVNVPDMVLPIPALTEKDRADLAFALEHGVDYIGLSFVQRPEDVAEAKAIAAGRAWIMTKMEKPQALDNLDEIIAPVGRGDGGARRPRRGTAARGGAAGAEAHRAGGAPGRPARWWWRRRCWKA